MYSVHSNLSLAHHPSICGLVSIRGSDVFSSQHDLSYMLNASVLLLMLWIGGVQPHMWKMVTTI